MRAHRSLSPRQQVLAHIVVGAHDKFVVGTWRKQTQALEYFRFALKAMSNQFFNFGKGRRHNVPMRWRKRNEWQLKQAFKRRQIVTHVTVGRQDHRRSSLQHMIPCKQKPLLPQQKTQMVGDMPRGMNHL